MREIPRPVFCTPNCHYFGYWVSHRHVCYYAKINYRMNGFRYLYCSKGKEFI